MDDTSKKIVFIISIIVGFHLCFMSIFLFFRPIVMALMGSEQSLNILYGCILIFYIGFALIIFSGKYNIRFVVGSIVAFVHSAAVSLIYFTFLPQMREMAKTMSSASGDEKGGGNVVFHQDRGGGREIVAIPVIKGYGHGVPGDISAGCGLHKSFKRHGGVGRAQMPHMLAKVTGGDA